MSACDDGERGTARLIGIQSFVRPIAASVALANDNRRRAERGSVSLARAVVGAPPVRLAAGAAARPVAPRPQPAPSAAARSRGGGWPDHPFALWSSGFDAAWRLPPIASGLALWRACSELGWAGAASCASIAASGVELVGVTIAGLFAAANPVRRPRDLS